MPFEIMESIALEDATFVFDRLSEYSDPFLGDEPRSFCLVGRSPDGVIIGGLVAKTGWEYLEVSHLWVDERQRKSGHASALMNRAERIAVERGCKHARLDTFDFQALNFYLKLGYVEFGHLSGYSGRFGRHFLYKAISSPMGASAA